MTAYAVRELEKVVEEVEAVHRSSPPIWPTNPCAPITGS